MKKTKKIFIFATRLGKKAIDDDLFALSNELAYKILLSFFPFMVFLVSLLGFLDLQDSDAIMRFFENLPQDIAATLNNFIAELQARPSAGLLSASLIVAMYSASNGFRAVMRGVNKAHGYVDKRNFIKKTAICAALMLIFTFSIVIMLGLWIFSDAILSVLDLSTGLNIALRIIFALIALGILIASISWIYWLACAQHDTVKILPGACTTVILWAASSEVFALFISNFSNISVIYGSIAGVFILIIWLNLISFFLLLGNSVNALLEAN